MRRKEQDKIEELEERIECLERTIKYIKKKIKGNRDILETLEKLLEK